MIDFQTLYDIIDESTKTIEICVPDRDYYARADDVSRTDLTYICPYTLLRLIAEKAGKTEQKQPYALRRLGNFE